jgi:uncharacterized protein with HEPN domain
MRHYKEYAKHIRDEIELLLSESAKMTEADLLEDPLRGRAFVRSLEIIGEAAKNLPEDIRKKYPQIEWRLIAGTRDRLIHHYYEVDYSLVWDIIQTKLRPLSEVIEQILADEQENA